jgi:PAS domain S-box-containing protein
MQTRQAAEPPSPKESGEPVPDNTAGGFDLDDASPSLEANRHAPREPSVEHAMLEYQFRLFVDGVTDYSIFLLDVGGNVLTWNAGAERIKGYVASEIVGRNFSVFYTEEDRQAGLPERGLSSAADEGRHESEGWRVRKDGSTFWANAVITAILDPDGNLIGYGKVTRDFSERKQTEEALRASQERFSLLVNGISDYAITMLDPKGNVISWNSGAAAAIGYSADEILGHHISEFYIAEDIQSGKPMRDLTIAEREGRYEDEALRVRKDGSRFLANTVIAALKDDDGNARGFASITRDITERKIAERDRRIAETLETALVPQLPRNTPGLDISVYYEAALDESNIGGDFYAVYSLDDTKFALVVGDVSGKGLAAASQVAMAQNIVRYLICTNPRLDEAIIQLNNAFVTHELIVGFVTLIIGIYDTVTNTLIYICCGHEPGLIRRKSGEIVVLDNCGPPLGVVGNFEYTIQLLKLEVGDALLLYTDGLSETGPDRTHMLETSGLESILRGADAIGAASLEKIVLDKVKAFGDGGFRDDVCLLTVVATQH